MMRGRCAVFLLAAALLLGAARPAAAADIVAVRAGDHLGFGRLVFDFPGWVAYRLKRVGQSVVLDFADPAPIGTPPFLPRNVVAFSAGAGTASLGLASGAGLRTMRVGDRIVLDALDPSAAAGRAAPSVRVASNDPGLPLPPPPIPLPLPPLPGGTAAAAPVAALVAPGAAPPTASPVLAAERPQPPATPAAPPAPSAASPAAPAPSGDAGPDLADLDGLALAANRVATPDGALAAILLPFGHDSGAAAFRRGDAGYVVFDETRPIDMGALAGDPAFGAARVTLLPAGTLLRVPLPRSLRLTLRHRDAGWVVAITAAAPAASAIVSKAASGTLALPLATASRVVVMPDPETGADLLIGTLHVPGAAVAVSRHFPGFLLLRTWLGVAVEPQSDHVVLGADADGFTLRSDAPGGLPLAPEPAHLAALEDAANLTSRFDFPAVPLATLAQRLTQELDAAVAAPRLARFAPRLAEAKTMLALGMGPEAAALIRLAVIDDPRRANDPEVHGLAAIAALLSGRIDQSGGLADPALGGSDEVALWRAVRAALRDEDPAGTAPVFAATCPLILAYPDALRDFLAPIAAESMVKGGTLAAASEFLAKAPDDPPLALARAGLLAAEGKTQAALAAYQTLVNSPDRPVAAPAASRAVLLQLASGAIGDRAAADALSRQFYAWRGGAHELRLRLKVAQLRADAGEWRASLDLLARTQALFPADATRLRDARAATFERLFAGHAADRLAPLALVSLIEDNADLIQAGPAGERLGEMLADRLVALDLPDRAEPVLAKLMAEAPPGAPQAGLGVRLAEIRLAQDDPAGALAALAQSRAADLPPALAERRTIAYARAMAAEGHDGTALAALAAFDDPPAEAIRAGLLERQRNWAGAESALAALVSSDVPASGPLSDADRQALVRLASAATEAGDTGGLATLGADYGPRMGAGPLADMFRLLTDPPARSLGDLPRVTRETTIAEDLPDELKAIGATMQVLP
ncbi:MAG TPA: hypothetical protein VMF62_09820 [Acetobacteraceae bacterium]|nr:hypothetical protein [Acetobacteraceae bacterium]